MQKRTAGSLASEKREKYKELPSGEGGAVDNIREINQKDIPVFRGEEVIQACR